LKLPRPGTAAERDTLLRQKLNRAFAQTDGIALALLGELDDLPSNDLGYGVGSIGQAQRAQGVFERSGEDRYLVRSKYMIFPASDGSERQMAPDVFAAFAAREPAAFPSSPRTRGRLTSRH